MNEIWKPVIGYEKTHIASNLGRVASLPREYEGITPNGIKSIRRMQGKILKQHVSNTGYYRTALTVNAKIFTTSTHRIIAMAFIKNPNKLPQVNHIDGCKTNNMEGNLEWCSASNNQRHAIEHGLINHPRGTNRAFAKLTDDDIRKIRIQISTGITQRLIAREFDVSPSQITSIKQGKTWAHVV